MMTTLRATGAKVVLMGDVPYPQTGLVPDCLSEHLTDAVACTMPKQYPYYNPSGVGQEEAVAAAAGAGYINTQPWFCYDLTCAVIVDNLLVYRDDNHITATYASWLTPVDRGRSGGSNRWRLRYAAVATTVSNGLEPKGNGHL